MAPPWTVQPSAREGVQPFNVVPSNIETRFGSPYGFPGELAGVWTVRAPLGGETLPAASRATTVMDASVSGVRPVQLPVVPCAGTVPHTRPPVTRSYEATPALSPDGAHATVADVEVRLTCVGVPGAVGA